VAEEEGATEEEREVVRPLILLLKVGVFYIKIGVARN
jgi:hypothetical protein